jgi:(1->4)-alpha-D-glucan 1-alpha-D-glucosylmutase
MLVSVKVSENRRPKPGNAIPVSTYRMQLNHKFTFADAKAKIPYLSKLGISHIYISPILQASPKSAHCYDIINHSQINDELGGAKGLEELSKVVHEHKMGIILDIVPNHSFPPPLNGDREIRRPLLGCALPVSHESGRPVHR